MKKSQQLKFLDNDVAILETMFANRDGHWLELPGEYMPDGQPFRVSLEGVNEMTGQLRQQLVQTVRDQYDARETEQNAEKRGNKAPREAPSGGTDSDSDNGGGSPVAETPPIQEPKESLLESLQQRANFLSTGLEQAEVELGNAREVRNRIQLELREVELCIRALQSGSPPTSTESESSEGRGTPRSGSTPAGRKGSKKRTTRKSSKNSKEGKENE